MPLPSRSLARTLILDEIFDLALYRTLTSITDGPLRDLLNDLVHIETSHVRFWQDFFHSSLDTLDIGRRLKLFCIVTLCRLGGPPAIHLILEAIEVYGIRKYLAIWKAYKDQPLGAAVRGILIDEFKHEDVIVSRMSERKINPEGIRNIFLGLNDGLVEIVGAVSGFFAAFGDTMMVLIAGTTTAVAGSISMGAGAYVALNSENEVKRTDEDKKRFLSEAALPGSLAEDPPDTHVGDSALGSAFVVGGSYFAGAAVPLCPVLLGAATATLPVLTAGVVVVVVSMVLAFLSGMDVKRRMAMNLMIVSMAVAVTYGIGMLVKKLWGIEL